MKTVICIEGADGSGKSTLAKLLINECELRGFRCQVIGRKSGDSSPDIGRITALSQELDKEAPPDAGFHLRIAREYLRAEECRRSDADVVILDRFVLSVLSRIRTDGTDADRYIEHLKAIARRAALDATVFCNCSFETAWTRLKKAVENGQRTAFSPKEAKGAPYLRELHDAMRRDFNQLTWLGRTYSIPTDQDETELRRHFTALFRDLLPEAS